MAKRASNKPAKQAAKAAAAAPAHPASKEPAQPLEQGMTATLSPEEVVPPLIETPPEVLGFFPPAATLPESDTGSLTVVEDGSAETPLRSDSPLLDSTHPAIALAQRHSTGAGVPREGAPRYFTAPPPDMFKRK